MVTCVQSDDPIGLAIGICYRLFLIF